MGGFVRRKLFKAWEDIAEADAKRKAGLTFPEGVTAKRNIAYLGDGDAMHLLDVWLPDGTDGLLPCIVDIHGGAWLYGDKDLNEFYCAWLAAHGCAVVSISYRLLPDTDLKGQVQDVFSALRWLENTGLQYHCDLQRVFLAGDSAGGHLCGLATCVQLSPSLQGLYGVRPVTFPIRAVAISHGVCDPKNMHLLSGKAGQFVTKEILMMLFGKKPQNSPLYNHASFEDTAPGLLLPPVMLISSEADDLHTQTLALQAFLEKNKAAYKLKFWTKEQGEHLGHVFNISYPNWPESEESNSEMLAFFAAALPDGLL